MEMWRDGYGEFGFGFLFSGQVCAILLGAIAKLTIKTCTVTAMILQYLISPDSRVGSARPIPILALPACIVSVGREDQQV
jgi:hypothetical protein